jgi:hypothetical protein
MAVTAHFVEDLDVTLESRLIAFRHVPGSHEGAKLGEVFVKILNEYGILHKIGVITADNASNNDTMLAYIEDFLTAEGIPFCRHQNIIRYVPNRPSKLNTQYC